MANMSYCRFQNTLSDLRDCYYHVNDDDLNEDEAEARNALLDLCKKILDESDRLEEEEEEEEDAP